MKLHVTILPLFLLGFCLNPILKAQSATVPSRVWQEAGLPYIRNFSPEDYSGGTQNFSIVQDERGLMYFGNTGGVLIYDGVSWRRISMLNRSAVRSLCVVNNRIFVGAIGDLGELTADAAGRLRFISLRNEIPEPYRNFEDVYSTVSIEDTIYFSTKKSIFRRAGGGMQVWTSTSSAQNVHVANGRLFVQRQGVGLMQMRGDALRLLPGGEALAGEIVRTIVPLDRGRTLIGTREHGLFLSDSAGLKTFPTAIDTFLYRYQLNNAANLPGGLIALATPRGVAIIDRDGQLRQIVNKAGGLRNEYILSCFTDRQGGLWLGLNNGIARVETPAPVSRFQARAGVESYVESIIRHRGRIYISTESGVHYLDTTTAPFPRFKPVTGFATLSWFFLPAGHELFVGTQKGIYRINGTGAARLNRLPAVVLYRSQRDSTKMFAGALDSLVLLQQAGHTWIDLGMVSDVKERVYGMVEDGEGTLWAGTPSQQVLQIEQDFSQVERDYVRMRVARFGPKHGLPPGTVLPARAAGKMFFVTSQGLRRFDPGRFRFVPDSTFGAVFADTLTQLTQLREDSRGDVWIIAARAGRRYYGRAVRQADGSYRWDASPFLRLRDLGEVYFVYPEDDGTVWFCGVEGLARFTPHLARDCERAYPVLIRRVGAVTADSVFYDGGNAATPALPGIDYLYNSLRFEFAAMSYDDAAANRYQVKLEGLDRSWSSWNGESKKDYTGLPPGQYLFRVRARNVYGRLSDEGRFAFAILPPWYRRWWAYLFYVALAGGLVALIVKGRVRYLEKKTRELESIVADRTAQIVQQKTKIEEQADRLQELDRMKSRFFANISHEFRTPLTLILGPLEDRIAAASTERDKKEYGLMHRNASRVLRLINQLLDLSRLEASKMKLSARPGDFVAFLKGIVMGFASLAEQKNIKLVLDDKSPRHLQGGGKVPVVADYFDPDKIEKIFTNLLSNACKFTPEGGEIRVEVQEVPETYSITIRDTGIGIAPDRLPYIFDRFYQADPTSTRAQQGTGIGLALIRELVALHHGSIAVQSKQGQGTAFTVRLPLGRAHLRPDEIVDTLPALPPQEPAVADLPQPGAPEPPPEPAAAAADANDTIILIVDDHHDVRRYVRAQLAPDYRIVEARDGRQGVEAAMDLIPDLVISDVMMPEMDGFQLCERLKTSEKTSHVPVILLTARADEADKLAGLEIGADDYLSKPFSSKELRVRVHNLIASRRKLRQRFRREGLLQPRRPEVSSIEETFVHKLMVVIEDNLGEEHFNPQILSDQLHMSLRQLQRKTRALTGQTPSDFIRTIRLQRARQLLEQHAGTVSEIAFRVGFNDLSYFSRCFRKEFGILPSEVET